MQLIPNEPTSSIHKLSKSQKRNFKLQKRQNKITFDPKQMYQYANSAQERHKERQVHFQNKQDRLKAEEDKIIRQDKIASSTAKVNTGKQILKKVKTIQQMSVDDIKQRLEELKNEASE